LRRLLSSQGMPWNLKAIRTDIIPKCIGVHPRTALDGIAPLRRGDGRGAREHYYCTGRRNEVLHDHFLLLLIQKAKSSLGPI
jgi:hypothetical protein